MTAEVVRPTTRKKALIKEVEAALKGSALDLNALSIGALLIVRDDLVLGLNRK